MWFTAPLSQLPSLIRTRTPTCQMWPPTLGILGVPRDLIPLCQDGDNYYCVEEDGTVVLWDAEEEGVGEDSWESVWHWARDVWLES